MKFEDVKYADSNYEIDFAKFIGKAIKAVVVYPTKMSGELTLNLVEIVFDDETTMRCEGEHDMPYLTTWDDEAFPTFTEENLESLHKQINGEDEE